MKYLVLRKDAIKRGGIASMHSSCFPIEVEVNDSNWAGEAYTSVEIVEKACNQLSENYRPGAYDYIVVPMKEALVVSFRRPQPKLDVAVSRYG